MSRPRVAIVGGGLAGLSAAAALSEFPLDIELYEARQGLGGRAGSFFDPESGAWVDHCQHVSMGCCTNLADLFRRAGLSNLVRRERRLRFHDRQGRTVLFEGSPLPAPLHLLPAFLRMHYLSAADKLTLAAGLQALTGLPRESSGTCAEWLAAQGQGTELVRRFWEPILVSALGDTLDRVGPQAAAKVLLDGFLATPEAYVVEVPAVPLHELYGERLADWLRGRGVRLHLGKRVADFDVNPARVAFRMDGAALQRDAAVLAVPWFDLRQVVAKSLWERTPELARAAQMAAAPITSVHLTFDRPLSRHSHAVLLERQTQWVFARDGDSERGFNYQAVISGSHSLRGRSRESVIEETLADLAAIWPAARGIRPRRCRVVTQRRAVFSMRPGIERLRPAQATGFPRWALAGDWTDTGWPATMEGAVRSGRLAADAIARAFGMSHPESRTTFLTPDLTPSLLTRWLFPAATAK